MPTPADPHNDLPDGPPSRDLTEAEDGSPRTAPEKVARAPAPAVADPARFQPFRRLPGVPAPLGLGRFVWRPISGLPGWLQARSFYPSWLPERWRHWPLVYSAVVAVQVLAFLATDWLLAIDPDFPFRSLLFILAIVVIAVNFGVGPSLTAALMGTLLLYLSVPGPRWMWRLADVEDAISLVVVGIVAVTVSIVASRAEQGRRQAVTASRQRDQFLSIASHELLTPLTTIKLMVHLAHRRVQRAADSVRAHGLDTATAADLEAVADMMTQMDEVVGRQTRMVDELLDVSRIEAGKLALAFAPCDLCVVVRDAVEEQRIQQPDRTILTDAPATPMPVLADRDRISQVVTNYLTNALKYSSSDQPVQVLLRSEDTSARVSVLDRGPGLSPEQQAHIWELYHRVPGIEVQSGAGIGLGLGLYLCRIIILAHSGEVGVDSVPSQGSTFWFTLPLTTLSG